MRHPLRPAPALLALGIARAPALASAQGPQADPNARTKAAGAAVQGRNAQAPAAGAVRDQSRPGPVIGSHQIDRFDAIAQLQKATRDKPDDLANWVILGELAQEVATEVPADQAPNYYSLAADAYQHALKLRPDDPGLRAALQFAQDQEKDADRFLKNRQQLTASYLDARRRELAQPNAAPMMRVFPASPALAPVPPPGGNAVAPRPGNTNLATGPAGGNADTPLAPSYLGGYTYQPYVNPNGQPYTYREYSSAYFPPSGTAAQPMTLRQYLSQGPRLFSDDATRRVTPIIPPPGNAPAAPPLPPE